MRFHLLLFLSLLRCLTSIWRSNAYGETMVCIAGAINTLEKLFIADFKVITLFIMGTFSMQMLGMLQIAAATSWFGCNVFAYLFLFKIHTKSWPWCQSILDSLVWCSFNIFIIDLSIFF